MPDSVSKFAPVLLDSEAARALVGSYAPVSKLAEAKDIGRIDPHMGKFISLSPICFVATADAEGNADVTPRGDPPGSFLVLDEKTIAIADRPGNNRLDTLKNLLANPQVALIFLLPGTNETVRVAGTGKLSVDPALLERMSVQGKAPKCAIVVDVRQAYLHCAKALLRSKLWTGDYAQPKGTIPSIVRVIADQVGTMSDTDVKAGEERTERAYRDGLWAPIT